MPRWIFWLGMTAPVLLVMKIGGLLLLVSYAGQGQAWLWWAVFLSGLAAAFSLAVSAFYVFRRSETKWWVKVLVTAVAALAIPLAALSAEREPVRKYYYCPDGAPGCVQVQFHPHSGERTFVLPDGTKTSTPPIFE